MSFKKFNVVTVAPSNYSHSAAFSELSETLVYGLNKLGCDTSNSINHIVTDAVNIILGAHLLTEIDIQLLPSNSIIYNTEQIDPTSAWMNSPLLSLMRQFATWDYSRDNIALLNQWGVNYRIQLVPVGYAPSLTRIAKSHTQDIDVLFYGSMSDRRQKIINELSEHNIHVVSVFNCYGEERDHLISRAKLVLNIHYYESKIFEIVRISYLLANRKAVVTEVNQQTKIESSFINSVAGAPYDQLVDTCIDLLHNENARITLEENGFKTIASLPIEDYLHSVISSSLHN